MPSHLFFAFFLFFSFFSSAQVVINEIDADTPGSDLLEFVELKSVSPNFSLDGYVLVFFNETNSSCYYAYDLDGFITDINGIIHFGNSQVTPAPAGIISNNRIQNGPDVVALYLGNASDFQYVVQPGTLATATNLIDAVAHNNTASVPTNLMSILGITICSNENANSQGTAHSIQRKNDGTYEVKIPTPGVNNDGSGVVLNYISVSLPQTNYIEGENIPITFTTSQPVSGSDLIFNFTLVNGNFMVNDYSGTNLTVSIPVGSTTTQNTVFLFDDTTDEGDEEMLINVQNLPFGYVSNNNNIIVRIYDNDFVVQSYGSPLSPTYGVVAPTIPAGYYDSLEGLSGNALKQELQNIIANPAVVRAHSYGDIEYILKEADKNPSNSNQVWQMYVESPRAILDYQVGSSNIGVWNREHIFPQSRGGFSGGTSSTADGIGVWLPTNADDILAGHADAHHLRAEDGAENSTRSNRDYGSDYNGPAGNQGSWNGDVARSLFYMAVRYNGLTLVNGNPSDAIVGQMGDLATLLTWNNTDPRDDFEMNRNNYIYTWQMNRNPFIDYPLLADYIFGANFGQPWSSTLSTQNPIENRVVVYPNPATEYLIVSGLEGISKVEIYTITGQLVLIQDFENNVQINLDLNSGMYLVKVTNGNQSTTKKIIVR
jgi:hypothetical protein